MNSQKSVVGLWYATANLGCEGCFGAWDDGYQCRAGITRDASGVMLRFLGELVRHDIHSARLFLLVRIQVWKQKVLTGWPSHGTKSCWFLLWAVELQKSQSPRSMKLLDEYSEARNWAYAEVKGNQKWTPLFCKEMHPGHKPGRFAEVGPESWPPMATKSAVLFFWHAFFTQAYVICINYSCVQNQITSLWFM